MNTISESSIGKLINNMRPEQFAGADIFHGNTTQEFVLKPAQNYPPVTITQEKIKQLDGAGYIEWNSPYTREKALGLLKEEDKLPPMFESGPAVINMGEDNLNVAEFWNTSASQILLSVIIVLGTMLAVFLVNMLTVTATMGMGEILRMYANIGLFPSFLMGVVLAAFIVFGTEGIKEFFKNTTSRNKPKKGVQ